MRFWGFARSLMLASALAVSTESMAKKVSAPVKHEPTAEQIVAARMAAEERVKETAEIQKALEYLWQRIPKTFAGESIPSARHADILHMLRVLMEDYSGSVQSPEWKWVWRDGVIKKVLKNQALRWPRIQRALESTGIKKNAPMYRLLYAQLAQESLLEINAKSPTWPRGLPQFTQATAMNREMVWQILRLEGGALDYRYHVEKSVAWMVYHMNMMMADFWSSPSWAMIGHSRGPSGASSIRELTRDVQGHITGNAWIVPTAIFDAAGKLYKSRGEDWAYAARQYIVTTVAMDMVLAYAEKAFPEHIRSVSIDPSEHLQEVNPISPDWRQIELPTKKKLGPWSASYGVPFETLKTWNPFLRAQRITTENVQVWVRADTWEKQPTVEHKGPKNAKKVRKKAREVVASNAPALPATAEKN